MTAFFLPALYLTGAKAACANIHLFLSTAYQHGYTLNIRVPDLVGSSVRMADVVTEMNALAADFTFRHDGPPRNTIRFARNIRYDNRFFSIMQD